MAINLASLLKQLGRDGSQGQNSSFFYLVDTADIDFRVEGFIGATGIIGDPTGSSNLVTDFNTKYVVLNEAGLTSAGIDAARQAGIANGDIIEKRSFSWGIHLDVSKSKTQEGALVYNKYDNKFYYRTPTDWVEIGAGTLTGDSQAIIVSGTEITARLASATVTGVASFDPAYFSVNGSGAVSLTAAYQATGNTVLPGIAIGIETSGNTKTINNLGVTGIVIAGQTLTGNVGFTGVGFYGLTGTTSDSYPTMAGEGHTGDRLLVATGPTNDPFRQYVKFGNAWVQTGVVGIGQGPQGLQGTQGLQGIQGSQGLQGIQGSQGTQGLQGIQGSQGTQGLQGIQGSQGTQGLQGIQGLRGATGTFPLSGYDLDTSVTHAAPTTLSGTGRARKILVLNDDGTLTFDNIISYDVFNPSDFQFAITKVDYTINTNCRKSVSNLVLGGSVAVEYRNGPPVTGHIVTVTSNHAISGFPVTYSASGTPFDMTSATVTGNPSSGSVVLQLQTTGNDAAPVAARYATNNFKTFFFRNDILFGVTAAAYLTGGISTNGIDRFVVGETKYHQGLSADISTETLLSYNKTVTTTTEETGLGQNDNFRLYVAYPARLHQESWGIQGFRLRSSTDPIGGMKLQGYNTDAGLSTVAYMNQEGFSENYKIWRSDEQFTAEGISSLYFQIAFL